MCRRVALVVCLAALAGCSQNPAASGVAPTKNATQGAGALTVSPTTIDLGEVKNEAVATVEFNISNSGSQPVRLLSGQTSCGCFYLTLPDSVPARSKVHVRSDLRIDESWYGPHEDTLSIRTDSATTPRLTIGLRGNYEPLIGFVPAPPFMMAFTPGRPLRISVAVHPRAGITLGSIKSDDPTFTARKEGSSLVLESRGARPPGDFSVKLSIAALPTQRVAFYSFLGEAKTGPVASPSRIDCPYWKADWKDRHFATLTVRSRSEAIQVVSAQSSDPALAVKFDPMGMVEVAYAGGWSPGAKHGLITIRTTDRVFPVLRVPFSVARVE